MGFHFLFIHGKDNTVHVFSGTILYCKEESVSGPLKIPFYSMAASRSYSEGFVWVLDLFPVSGAVLFFATPVRHEAGTKTEHMSVKGYMRRIL